MHAGLVSCKIQKGPVPVVHFSPTSRRVDEVRQVPFMSYMVPVIASTHTQQALRFITLSLKNSRSVGPVIVSTIALILGSGSFLTMWKCGSASVPSSPASGQTLFSR